MVSIAHLVGLVERLSVASGPDALLEAVKEFSRAVADLAPEESSSEAVEVLDELAYDLNHYSPQNSWEDASLLNEEQAREEIGRALESLKTMGE